MKLLIVEDDLMKRECLTSFLKSRNIDMHCVKAVNPGIKYVCEHKDEISGIILDLGLTTDDDSEDYSWVKGLELIIELDIEDIHIPILINSSALTHTVTDMEKLMKHFGCVKGQMYVDNDYHTLENFINSLQ